MEEKVLTLIGSAAPTDCSLPPSLELLRRTLSTEPPCASHQELLWGETEFVVTDAYAAQHEFPLRDSVAPRDGADVELEAPVAEDAIELSPLDTVPLAEPSSPTADHNQPVLPPTCCMLRCMLHVACCMLHVACCGACWMVDVAVHVGWWMLRCILRLAHLASCMSWCMLHVVVHGACCSAGCMLW